MATVTTPNNINRIVGAVRQVTDLKGMSLAIFGALIAIAGNVMKNRMATILGLGLFIPGVLAGILNVGDQFGDLTQQVPSAVTNSIVGVVAIGALTLIISSRTNFVLNLLLMLGFGLLISGVISQRREPSPPRVEYRFVPRTFKEEAENPVKISDIFSDMFSLPSPWPISGYASNDANFVGRRSLDRISRPFS